MENNPAGSTDSQEQQMESDADKTMREAMESLTELLYEKFGDNLQQTLDDVDDSQGVMETNTPARVRRDQAGQTRRVKEPDHRVQSRRPSTVHGPEHPQPHHSQDSSSRPTHLRINPTPSDILFRRHSGHPVPNRINYGSLSTKCKQCGHKWAQDAPPIPPPSRSHDILHGPTRLQKRRQLQSLPSVPNARRINSDSRVQNETVPQCQGRSDVRESGTIRGPQKDPSKNDGLYKEIYLYNKL